MARKPGKDLAPADLAPLPEGEINAAQLAASVATQDVARWLHAAQASGRMQAAAFLETVSSRLIAKTFEDVRHSKSYVGMPFVHPDGKTETVSTLDQFCELVLGKSSRRCRQLLDNLELLGDDLYETAEQIGLGQRDYNALKALPADDQAVIKQALEEGADKATVIEKLVSLVERQSADKNKLHQQVDDARATNEALEERTGKLSEQVEKAEQKAAKAARKWRAATPDEQRTELEQAVRTAVTDVRTAIARHVSEEGVGLRGTVMALAEHAVQNNQDVGVFLGNVFAELLAELQLVRDDESLPVAIPVVEFQG